jgi:hypothetical protein
MGKRFNERIRGRMKPMIITGVNEYGHDTRYANCGKCKTRLEGWMNRCPFCREEIQWSWVGEPLEW